MRMLTHLAGLAGLFLRRRSSHVAAIDDVHLWCRASTLLRLRERSERPW